MITSTFFKNTATLALALTLFTGCQSKQDAAIDQAKAQANSTGQAQQVITTDKSGTTTTTTIDPAAPGQPQRITTTTTSTSAPVAGTTTIPASSPAVAGGTSASQPAYATQSGTAPTVSTPGGDPIIRPADVNVPTGTPVGGIVDASHRRGHFKGASILQLRLTSLTLNGTRYPLETHDLTRTKKGKGKRSLAFIGGGTGLGMLIGGVATGGTGLLIGGLAGAGAGTGIAALTGNRDLDIPSESIVRFKLADSLTLGK
jgi:hypothetical protein